MRHSVYIFSTLRVANVLFAFTTHFYNPQALFPARTTSAPHYGCRRRYKNPVFTGLVRGACGQFLIFLVLRLLTGAEKAGHFLVLVQADLMMALVGRISISDMDT